MTVDTEPSIAGAFQNKGYMPLLHEPVAGMVDGKSHGLGFLIETLRRYGLVATFFVETIHTRYFPKTLMGNYVEALLREGQDVQLHLHPCWLAFSDGKFDPSGPLTDDCDALEICRLVALIEDGSELIRHWTGRRPTTLRSGNFSTALSVFNAMRQAGLRHASNICLAVRRPPEPELAVTGGVHEFFGVLELPVTCFKDVQLVVRSKLRAMSVTALTAQEHIALLTAAHAEGNSVVVILMHPFEFIKKRDFRYTDLRPNRIVQKRLEKLCAFLCENSDRFEVVPLATAAEALRDKPSWTDLSGNWLSSVARGVQNAANDRLGFL